MYIYELGPPALTGNKLAGKSNVKTIILNFCNTTIINKIHNIFYRYLGH